MARELTRLFLAIPIKGGPPVTVTAYRTLVPGLYAHKDLTGSGWSLSDDHGHYHPSFHSRTLKGIREQIELALRLEGEQCIRVAMERAVRGTTISVAEGDSDDPDTDWSNGIALGFPPSACSIAEHWSTVANVLRAFPGSLMIEHKDEASELQ